jgi:hypothetical protein
MREWRRTGALPLAGMAAAGMVLGHDLAYRLAVPDAHARSAVLLQSGHGYWLLAVKAAVILGLSGAGAFVARHLRSAQGKPCGPMEAFVSILIPLAAMQLVGYTCMEIVERAAVGAPVAGLFHHHLYLLGVAVQFLVACTGGLVLLALGRGASALAELLARTWEQAPRILSSSRAIIVPPATVLAGRAVPRAPPRS